MRTFVVAMVMYAATVAAPASDETAAFRYWRAVDRGNATTEDIVAFPLDSAIYAATRDGLPDLRVFDDQNVATPYQVEPSVEYFTQRSQETSSVHIRALHETNGAIEVLVDRLPKSHSVDGFRFSTPQNDFERKVQVYGSNDGVDWTPLVHDGLLFDYARYMDVSNLDVPLPTNHFRRFKIVVEAVTDQKTSPYQELTRTFQGSKESQRVERTTLERRTFRVDRITAWHTAAKQRVQRQKTVTYAAAAVETKQDAGKKSTIVRISTHREPLTSLTLQTDDRNFLRRAAVEVLETSATAPVWREIGSDVVSCFRFHSYRRDHLTVWFPEHRETTYRLVIHNEDNPPLDVHGVTLEGPDYRVAFLAKPSASYRVYYDSKTAQAPKYDAAEVLAALRSAEDHPATATLGPPTENASFVASADTSSGGPLNNWIFLGAAVAVMVAALAWMLFRAGRRLEQLSK
ncbi:MAG: DUF3999 family protein [Thermoguttaceae bacterium]